MGLSKPKKTGAKRTASPPPSTPDQVRAASRLVDDIVREHAQTEGQAIADLWDQLDEIVVRRGLTADEKDLLHQGFCAFNMYQLAHGEGRFFEVACQRLPEIVPQLLKHYNTPKRRRRTP